MSLVVETGQIVAGANTWVSRTDYIAYALARGVVIANTTAADVQLVTAREFIDSHEARLKGSRVSREQETAYPRDDLEIEGFHWGTDEIPRQVILCQLAYALDLNAGVDIYNPQPVRTRKKEKVEGAVEVEYFGEDKAVKLSRESRAQALLSSLMDMSGLYSIQLVRR